jgi:hypothetical protein
LLILKVVLLTHGLTSSTVPPLISLFDGHGGGEGVSLHHQEEDVIEGASTAARSRGKL